MLSGHDDEPCADTTRRTVFSSGGTCSDAVPFYVAFDRLRPRPFAPLLSAPRLRVCFLTGVNSPTPSSSVVDFFAK